MEEVTRSSIDGHAGFEDLLTRVTSQLTGSARVSDEALGAVLQQLVIAAPDGLLRSALVERAVAADGSPYSQATVAKALSALEKGKLISRAYSHAGPAGGRPPERYRVGSEHQSMLGIHVSLGEGGFPKALIASLHDLSGVVLRSDSRILREEKLPWPEVAREIALFANQIIKTWKDRGEGDKAVLGLGVEIPGHVHRGKVVQADHAGYELPDEDAFAPFAQLISEGLEGLPVVLDNDVNLIALREIYRPQASSRPHNGAVVAVFEKGLGAGLVLNGRVYRGYRGAAGELGHNPVFSVAGSPRLPLEQTMKHRKGEPLGFADPCSCKKSSHVDCYAIPERLFGELKRPRSDFAQLATAHAYDSNGRVTAEGEVFWKGGAALGLTLASLLHSHNPGWLLLLLPPELAQARPSDGTAAGLYRQAIETLIDESTFSTTAGDARQGGRELEVRALAADSARGAQKAARNAALLVLDEFVTHALKRDECVQDLDAERVKPPVAPPANNRQELRARELTARKDLSAILRLYDPEGLLAAGTPADDYSGEEAELLRLVIEKQVNRATVRDTWKRRFGDESKLLTDEYRLNDLVRELTALQTRWHA